jgi:transcriptional regulator GlxA family with amidase domain
MDPRIKLVITLIEEDITGELGLEEMARFIGLSTSRLRHKFKSEIGVTPTAYAQNLRMRRAVELLKSGRLSVKEVRARIGLESASYFAHQCRRVYGLPPSHLRYSNDGDCALYAAQPVTANNSHSEQQTAIDSDTSQP